MAGDREYTRLDGGPLMLGNHVLGVLTADYYTPDAYHEEDGHILQTFANQASIAIHNAQLFQEIDEAKERALEAKQAVEKALQVAETAQEAALGSTTAC